MLVAPQLGQQHPPAVHGKIAAQGALQLRVQLLRLDRGQKPQAAQVHREDRNVAPPHGARGREQRAVAAQHDQQLRAVGDLIARQSVPGRCYVRPRLLVQPASECRAASATRSTPARCAPPRAARLGENSDGFRDRRLARRFRAAHKVEIRDCLPRPGSDFRSSTA